MALKVETIRSLTKLFQDLGLRKRCMKISQTKVASYTTIVSRNCIDILDLFTDILLLNRERSQFQNATPSITPLKIESFRKNVVEELCTNIDFTDMVNAKSAIDKILRENINNHNWTNVYRLTVICSNEKIPLDDSRIQFLVKLFSNGGFLKGLLQLRVLLCTTQPDRYIKQGELLMQLGRCYWIAGNSKECFIRIGEFFTKYPNLKDVGRQYLRDIIFEAVRCRSEAELKRTISFFEEYTKGNNDYYFMAVLWNHLFLSDWFADQNLADELLHRHEELKSTISLMATSLARYFVKHSKINDVYRLLQLFLKYQMMDSYAVVSQILFDYYFRKGDQYACSEIVKSSVQLKSALREEQYNCFISWCATGDPFKCLPIAEIRKIYSKF